MPITQIHIDKFRKVSDVDIEFGPRLNAIAGQNGTIKTSLLGLIGHIFTFKKNHKTLGGRDYTTQYGEIFKFSYPKYDRVGEHAWQTTLDGKESIQAVSYARKQSATSETLRIRVGKSIRGSGKIHYPVIYLGMNRLFPSAQQDDIKVIGSVLQPKEIKEFKDLHNEILLMDHDVVPESVESKLKNFYAPSTSDYGLLGNSAGQDNIGQIITALFSFRRLRDALGADYKGGILLIDEIDASLYPAAQIKLIEKLHKKSKELNLQIFFTTHSLEILSEVLKYQKDSKVIFLDKSSGNISPTYNLDVDNLRRNLMVLGPAPKVRPSKSKALYCEDDEAKDFLKNILPKDIKNKLDVISTGLGCGELKNLAKRNLPAFKDALIVLDGDNLVKSNNTIISLPGEDAPDRLIYELLQSLDDGNSFWQKTSGYTKQFCFKHLMSLDSTTDKDKQREKLKKWYLDQKKHWHTNASFVWDLWILRNKKEADIFIASIKKLIT